MHFAAQCPGEVTASTLLFWLWSIPKSSAVLGDTLHGSRYGWGFAAHGAPVSVRRCGLIHIRLFPASAYATHASVSFRLPLHYNMRPALSAPPCASISHASAYYPVRRCGLTLPSVAAPQGTVSYRLPLLHYRCRSHSSFQCRIPAIALISIAVAISHETALCRLQCVVCMHGGLMFPAFRGFACLRRPITGYIWSCVAS